jgi:hypothetical protein
VGAARFVGDLRVTSQGENKSRNHKLISCRHARRP